MKWCMNMIILKLFQCFFVIYLQFFMGKTKTTGSVVGMEKAALLYSSFTRIDSAFIWLVDISHLWPSWSNLNRGANEYRGIPDQVFNIIEHGEKGFPISFEYNGKLWHVSFPEQLSSSDDSDKEGTAALQVNGVTAFEMDIKREHGEYADSLWKTGISILVPGEWCFDLLSMKHNVERQWEKYQERQKNEG